MYNPLVSYYDMSGGSTVVVVPPHKNIGHTHYILLRILYVCNFIVIVSLL